MRLAEPGGVPTREVRAYCDERRLIRGQRVRGERVRGERVRGERVRGERVRERNEHEACNHAHRGAFERKIRAVEAGGILHVARGQERAVERVRPRMVGAAKRSDRVAVAALAETRAAMPADVVERVHRTGLVAHDDQALAGDAREQIVARLRNAARMTHADPLACEEAFALRAERVVRQIEFRGERSGLRADRRPHERLHVLSIASDAAIRSRNARVRSRFAGSPRGPWNPRRCRPARARPFCGGASGSWTSRSSS